MKLTQRIFAAALFVLLFSAPSFAQDASYSKKLHAFLEANGTMETFKTAIKGMIETMSQSNDKIPAEFWAEFEKEAVGTSLDDLVALLAPVYSKHLTEADLDKLMEFYHSPVGKKLADKTPIITQESMLAGQAWGQKLGERVVARMKEKGYK